MRYGSENQYENACSSPRDRIDFGMRGQAARQRSAEVGAPQRVELARQLVRHRAFGERQDAPGVTEHVRVARVVDRRGRALYWLLAHRARDLVGADPTVAVPTCAARIELDAVDHAVTDEPVVRTFRHAVRVRPGAQVAPLQLRRDRPVDDEVHGRDLLVDRAVVAGQERVLGHRHGCSSGRRRVTRR